MIVVSTLHVRWRLYALELGDMPIEAGTTAEAELLDGQRATRVDIVFH